MALLDVENVTRRFGGVVALGGVDLQVEPGEILAIVGPNGSGKTTLFNVISGFMKPSSGAIRFDGARIDGLGPVRLAKLGLVRTFQQAMCFQGLTVRANVEAGRLGAGAHRADALDRALSLCGLTGLADVRAGDLPYGSQRKLGVAVALATSPRLLLLDEPAAGLSDEASGDLATLIRTVRNESVTVVVIDHDMPFVLPLADRVVVLDAGKKLFEGTPDEVRSHAKVVEVYLGTEFE